LSIRISHKHLEGGKCDPGVTEGARASFSKRLAAAEDEAFLNEHTGSLNWQKSSRSLQTTNCLEVATDGYRRFIRDSKNPEIPPLSLHPAQFSAFISAAKSGAFDRSPGG
jgi:hypothetical protein